jgi:hypothetical protein
LLLCSKGEKVSQRWLNIKSVMEFSVTVDRIDFLMANPSPVLIAAEIRDGKLVPSPLPGRNLTMHHLNAATMAEAPQTQTSPVRFMPIRPPQAAEGAHGSTWFSVGRTIDSEIVINDYTVSKQHARMKEDPPTGQFIVQDLGSTNGSWVNKKRLIKGDSRPLKSGDALRFGRHVFTFLNARDFYGFLKDLASTESLS